MNLTGGDPGTFLWDPEGHHSTQNTVAPDCFSDYVILIKKTDPGDHPDPSNETVIATH